LAHSLGTIITGIALPFSAIGKAKYVQSKTATDACASKVPSD
jgi:hypothetical protein